MTEQQQEQGWTTNPLPSFAGSTARTESTQDATLRLVLVEWEDSQALTAGGWMHLDGEWSTEPRLIYSVGWLFHDGERSKIIVPHANRASPDKVAQGTGVLSIPARCVVRMVSLVEQEEP